MDPSRRIGLILPPGMEPWRRFTIEQGFARLAEGLLAAGHRVDGLCFEQPAVAWPTGSPVVRVAPSPVPLLCGPAAMSVTRSLRCGHELWRHVRDQRYDALLAPLGNGLLQPCLMSRALGESLHDTAMLLWADTDTHARILADPAIASPALLIDDALERTCLGLADALFAPGDRVLDRCRALGAPVSSGRKARLMPYDAGEDTGDPASGQRPTLWHMGPGNRAYGADRFLDAVEGASDGGTLPWPRIGFAGPWRAEAAGLSKALLGVRAQHWPFRFAMRDASPRDAAMLPRPDGDQVAFLGRASDDDILVELALARGVAVSLSSDHRLAQCYPDRIDDALRLPRSPAAPPQIPELSPAMILAETGSIRSRPPHADARADGRVSLCIVHRDRSALLPHAVASASASASVIGEIVIADAGSVEPQSGVVLDRLAAQGANVLRLGPVGHRPACDAAARAARGDILVFLDDDNGFIADGCRRMAQALEYSDFDIVVTNLALHDDPFQPVGAQARAIFAGQGHSATPLFNCLGDSSLAIRRRHFEQLGGFGYNGAGNDWAFLARAQASGSRIGVLQDPAVAYRVDRNAAQDRWRKRDQEGARAQVIENLLQGSHFQFILLPSISNLL